MSASQPNLLFSRKSETGMCSPPVLRTETISQCLPAAKQDERCIKTDSGHFDYLTDTTTSHFLARAKLEEPLQVALVTSIPPLVRQTFLSSATVIC